MAMSERSQNLTDALKEIALQLARIQWSLKEMTPKTEEAKERADEATREIRQQIAKAWLTIPEGEREPAPDYRLLGNVIVGV